MKDIIQENRRFNGKLGILNLLYNIVGGVGGIIQETRELTDVAQQGKVANLR